MMCDMECDLEHIDANIINERKIRVEGKLRTKYRVYKEEKIDVVKELDGLGDLQIKRKPESIEEYYKYGLFNEWRITYKRRNG